MLSRALFMPNQAIACRSVIVRGEKQPRSNELLGYAATASIAQDVGGVSSPGQGLVMDMCMEKLSASTLLAAYQSGRLDFASVTLNGVDLFEQDLRGIVLSQAVIQRAYLPYINLSNATLDQAQFQGSELSDAKLYNVDARKSNFQGAMMARANLRKGNFQGAILAGANLYGADLRSADLRHADLRGADLTRADLTGALLAQADLAGCNLFRAQQVDVSEALCDRTTVFPDGHRNYP